MPIITLLTDFGNAITNIRRADLPDEERVRVRAGATSIVSLSGTYGEVEPGSPLALIGSSGHLEISVARGRAADILSLPRGTPVEVRRDPA